MLRGQFKTRNEEEVGDRGELRTSYTKANKYHASPRQNHGAKTNVMELNTRKAGRCLGYEPHTSNF